jgi:hypothetical protein
VPGLTPIEVEMAAAWESASSDLGFVVETARSVSDSDGNQVVYAVKVPQFGSARGTVCRHIGVAADEMARFRSWASAVGAFCSILADSYRSYERGLWVDTLNDWGWTADGAPPPWYTGAPWTT